MIINLLALSPEIMLIMSLVTMLLVNHYRQMKTPKTFYTISKVFLVLSTLSAIIFFNQSGFNGYWQNNSYTTLFKVCIFLLALTWFFLSCKWFLNKNHSSLSYYLLGMSSILMLMLIISATDLLILFTGLLGYFVLTYLMMYLSDNEFEVEQTAKLYLKFAMFFSVLFVAGLIMIYIKVGSFNYTAIYEYFVSQDKITLFDIITYAFLLSPILFMIGLAPFHFWFAEVISVSILPVSGFYTLIPVFAGFSCLVNLCLNIFFPLISYIKPILILFAAISLLLGAISANKEQNIRRLFAYSSLYNLGFIFITLSTFNYNSIAASFVYLVVYILSICGIYTVFYGFKSNGEYLYKLEDISGIFTQKSYISVAFLVFTVSLAGSPPMLGFLGKLAVVNNLVIEGRYWSLGVAIFAMLLMITAYLDVIKTIFFDERKRNFDRADKGIYICLFINIIIILISILQPSYLMGNLEKLLIPVL